MSFANIEELRAFVEGVNQLYEIRFGYPPTGTDKVKAAEYVKWRYGGQGFVDAVKRIQELNASQPAAPTTFAPLTDAQRAGKWGR